MMEIEERWYEKPPKHMDNENYESDNYDAGWNACRDVFAQYITEELRDLMFKTDKDMQMNDAITLYPLVIKRLNSIIKKLGE